MGCGESSSEGLAEGEAHWRRVVAKLPAPGTRLAGYWLTLAKAPAGPAVTLRIKLQRLAEKRPSAMGPKRR